jgi:hypothetical protein
MVHVSRKHARLSAAAREVQVLAGAHAYQLCVLPPSGRPACLHT